MLGAQRRVEGRIGQLLGKPPGRGKKEISPHADSFHRERREEFRILARAFERCDDEEWRKSRLALVLGTAKHRTRVTVRTVLPTHGQV